MSTWWLVLAFVAGFAAGLGFVYWLLGPSCQRFLQWVDNKVAECEVRDGLRQMLKEQRRRQATDEDEGPA